MSFLPKEAGANVVVTIDSDAHVRIHRVAIIDDELGCLAIVCLLNEGQLHATDEIVVIAVHVEKVHQVRQIAHRIDMTVEVTIHVAEGIVHGMSLLDGAQAAYRLNRTWQVGDLVADIAQL